MKIGRGLRALAVLLCLLMAMFAAACTADVPSGGSDGGSGGTEQPGGGSGNEGEGGDEGGSGDEGEGDNEGGSGSEGEGGDEDGSGSEGEGGDEGGETDPPAPQEYEISFWNEGSLYHTLTTAGNEVLTLPAEPERTGYTFTGWFFDETAQTQPFDAHTYETVPLTQDEDVYAGWSLKTYTVTFDTNDGGAVAPLQTARIESADALTVPQKQGFLFAGWYLDKGLKHAVTYPYIPTGNVTFYAKWEQEPASSASFTVDEKGVLTAAEASGDVVIPERVNGITVTQIGQRVFEKNQEITSVSLPDTVQLVGYAAFDGCKNLQAVDLGEGVQRIHDNAFRNCSALESIEFPASLRSISSDVFRNTGLRSVSLNKVGSVGDYAFAECKQLSSLDLGVVRAFGRSVFQDCVALTEVSLPETVAGSGIELFGGCTALAKVDLPESGIALQYNAFVGTPCAAAADNRQDGMLIIDGYLFGANEKFKGTSVLRLPEGIVSVAAAAMSASYGARGCVDSLSSVVFPQSIRSIGSKAFYNCPALASVEMPQGVKLNGVGEDVFKETPYLQNDADWEDDGLYLANWLLAVKDTAMTSFTVREGTEYIVNSSSSSRLFTKTAAASLQSLTLPSSLKAIGDYAFYYLGELTSVTLPAGLEHIGDDAFANCSKLAQVNLGDCKGLVEIGSAAFYSCALTAVTIPASVQTVGNYAFNLNKALKIYCEAAEQPGGWGSDWNYCGGEYLPVEWGSAAP